MRFDDDNVNFTKIDGKINLKDFIELLKLTKKSEMKRETETLAGLKYQIQEFPEKLKLFV
jgi:polyhydroxyalkanoate synthesis regulator phasin